MMNPWLADMYGTNSASPVQDPAQEKTAQLELFAKLAAEQNIDLTTLSPQQVNELYTATFSKTAEDEHEESETPAEEEKEEEAKAEHEEAKESAAKFAEADIMGRTMAHALVNELGEIEKSAGRVGDAAKAVGDFGKRVYEGAKGHGSRAYEGAKSHGSRAYGGAVGLKDRAKDTGKKVLEGRRHLMSEGRAAEQAMRGASLKDKYQTGMIGHALKGRAAQAAPYAAGAVGLGGVGAAGAAVHKSRKEASALDEFAYIQAVKTAAAAGYNTDQAQELIQAAYSQGQVGESTKIAYVDDTSDAIHVRGLEMLEAAGYPVNWEEVFGG